MFTSLQIKFLIFIAIVVIITAGFAILISRQMRKMSKKALTAKQCQKDYQNQLDGNQTEHPGE